MEEWYKEPRISVSIGRRLNLGNYESVDIFMSVSGVEPGTTTEEIEELLITGDRAFQLLKTRIGAKISEIKKARKDS